MLVKVLSFFNAFIFNTEFIVMRIKLILLFPAFLLLITKCDKIIHENEVCNEQNEEYFLIVKEITEKRGEGGGKVCNKYLNIKIDKNELEIYGANLEQIVAFLKQTKSSYIINSCRIKPFFLEVLYKNKLDSGFIDRDLILEKILS